MVENPQGQANSSDYERILRELIEETKRKTEAELARIEQLQKLDDIDVIRSRLDATYRCVYEVRQMLLALIGKDIEELQRLRTELVSRGIEAESHGGISVQGKSVDVKVRGDMIGGDLDHDKGD